MFNIKPTQVTQSKTEDGSLNLWEINIPILSAYSVEYISANLDSLSMVWPNECFVDNVIKFPTDFDKSEIKNFVVVVNYHGIKEYEALFPWIKEEKLINRIAKFYAELEKCYENEAWLPALLMSGAVIEGLLYAKLGYQQNILNDLITIAQNRNLVSVKDASILHGIRRYRNLVHANNYNESFVSRKEALEVKTVIDRIIKKFADC